MIEGVFTPTAGGCSAAAPCRVQVSAIIIMCDVDELIPYQSVTNHLSIDVINALLPAMTVK